MIRIVAKCQSARLTGLRGFSSLQGKMNKHKPFLLDFSISPRISMLSCSNLLRTSGQTQRWLHPKRSRCDDHSGCFWVSLELTNRVGYEAILCVRAVVEHPAGYGPLLAQLTQRAMVAFDVFPHSRHPESI
jgi:hypothetical protein